MSVDRFHVGSSRRVARGRFLLPILLLTGGTVDLAGGRIGLRCISAGGGPPGDVTILGTGLGRTGTSSLAKSLVEMGYTEGPQIYNMRAVLKNLAKSVVAWRHIVKEHAEGRPVTELFRKLLKGYTVVTDYPACAWWEEIHKAFPGAKLLHTTRDPEEWYTSSVNSTFAFVKFARTNDLRGLLDIEQHWTNKSRKAWIDEHASNHPRDVRKYGALMQKAAWDRLFGIRVDPSDPQVRQQVIDGYKRQDARVRQVNDGKPGFMEWKVGEATWESLCRFLDIAPESCPSTPFPHSNPLQHFYEATLRPILNGRLRPPGQKARGKPEL